MKAALLTILGSFTIFALILGTPRLCEYLEHKTAAIKAETAALEAQRLPEAPPKTEPRVITLTMPADPQEFEPITHPEAVSAINSQAPSPACPVKLVGSWNENYLAEAFPIIAQHSMVTLTTKTEAFALIELGPAVVLSALNAAELSPRQHAQALNAAKAFLNVPGRRSYAFNTSGRFSFHRLPYIEADGVRAPMTYISPAVAQHIDHSNVVLIAFKNPECGSTTAIDVVINPPRPYTPPIAVANPKIASVQLYYPTLNFRFIQPGPEPGDAWLQALDLNSLTPEPEGEPEPPQAQAQVDTAPHGQGGPSAFDLLSFAVSVAGLFTG